MAHLPPDPDDMNDKRAQWAAECISLFSELTGAEEGPEAMGDLLTNLFHWCDRNGLDMEAVFASRKQLYAEETAPFDVD